MTEILHQAFEVSCRDMLTENLNTLIHFQVFIILRRVLSNLSESANRKFR